MGKPAAGVWEGLGEAQCRPGDQDLVSLCVKARGAQPSGHEGQSDAHCHLQLFQSRWSCRKGRDHGAPWAKGS